MAFSIDPGRLPVDITDTTDADTGAPTEGGTPARAEYVHAAVHDYVNEKLVEVYNTLGPNLSDGTVRLSRVMPRLVNVRDELGILTAAEGGTGTAAKINDAIVNQGLRRLYFPGMGSYYELENTSGVVCAGPFTDLDDIEIAGEGVGLTTFQIKAGQNSHGFSFVSCQRAHLHDFTIDGQRTLQTGGHCIRANESEFALLERLRSLHSYGYGIAWQVASQHYNTMRDTYIFDCGADGMDLKNRDTFDNIGWHFDRVIIDTPGARGPIQEPQDCGLDVRGPGVFTNIWVKIDPLVNNTLSGIRFRTSGTPDPDDSNGPGGLRSSLTNFYVEGANFGLAVANDDTGCSNGTLVDCNVGVSTSGQHSVYSQVRVVDALDDGWRINDPTQLVACTAIGCGADGFRLNALTDLHGCSGIGNASDGVTFDTGSDHSKIIGGRFNDNAGYGLQIGADVTGVDVGKPERTGNGAGAIHDQGIDTEPLFTIRLPVAEATLTGTNPASIEAKDGTGSQPANSPTPRRLRALFDKDTDQTLQWQIAIPSNYLSHGRLRFRWGSKVTSGDVKWKAGLAVRAVPGASLDNVLWNAVDTIAAVTVPDTVGKVLESVITLTMTNVGPTSEALIFLGRDADDGADTAAGDATLLQAVFEYTGVPT